MTMRTKSFRRAQSSSSSATETRYTMENWTWMDTRGNGNVEAAVCFDVVFRMPLKVYNTTRVALGLYPLIYGDGVLVRRSLFSVWCRGNFPFSQAWMTTRTSSQLPRSQCPRLNPSAHIPLRPLLLFLQIIQRFSRGEVTLGRGHFIELAICYTTEVGLCDACFPTNNGNFAGAASQLILCLISGIKIISSLASNTLL